MLKSLSRRRLLKNTMQAAGMSVGAQVLVPKSAGADVKNLWGLRSPQDSQALPPDMVYTSLSNPIEQLFQTKKLDIVVIGSGYGGSVLASRLKTKFPEKSLAILEKGKEWRPGEFPKNLAEASKQSTFTNPLGLYEFHFMNDLDIFQGSGLGGTSLVNANVAIEPDAELWAQPEWPQELNADFQSGRMAEYYARARAALQPESYPVGQNGFGVLKKDDVLKEGTEATGGKYRQVDVAINFSRKGTTPNFGGVFQKPCRLCGDCVTGCNFGAKNTLNMNYLPFAKKAGAQIFTQVTVQSIRELKNDPEGFRFSVHFLYQDTKGKGYPGEVKTRNVVVSAGVIGTNKLLLKSKAMGFLQLSNALGNRVSSNGDSYGMGLVSQRSTNIKGIGTNRPVKNQAFPGPTMESAGIYNASPNLKDRFIIEHSAIPSAMNAPAELFAAVRNPKGVSDPLNKSMLYLGCGHDDAGGKLFLDKKGSVNITWPGLKNQPVFHKIHAAMKAQAERIGSTYSSPNFRNHPITVHPLGGCVMAESADRGAVDSYGRAFNASSGNSVYQGLYVADGSIVPTSIGVNPFLTITALSERIADLIQEKDL